MSRADLIPPQPALPESGPRILAVDLDGTLIRSDMLYESFWSALASDWRMPALVPLALLRGRAALKRLLANHAAIDATTLPYNDTVLDYVRDWRARGGRTVLVTASDQSWAEAIGAHLGLFDEVHGSTAGRNLKGPAKAAFLIERFGRGGYAYVGDARADLPVWAGSGHSVTLDAPAWLRAEVDAFDRPSVHLTSSKTSILPYLRALRPHQWLKNLLVFVPMLAAHELDRKTLMESATAFAAFCLMASCIYIVNDLVDLQADRAHPRKRRRPFASGAVPIPAGMALSGLLLILGVILSAGLGPKFMWAILFYFVATSAYSFVFKRRLVIDICLLAGLYTVRIIGGGFATGISLSVWLLGLSVFLFFALAAVKRQAELVDSRERGEQRASGRGYRVDDLPLVSMMAVAAGYVSVLVMALYVNLPQVAQFYSYPKALWGICPVLLYWISRMVMVTHRGEMNDDPLVFAARDGTSRLCLILVAIFTLAAATITT